MDFGWFILELLARLLQLLLHRGELVLNRLDQLGLDVCPPPRYMAFVVNQGGIADQPVSDFVRVGADELVGVSLLPEHLLDGDVGLVVATVTDSGDEKLIVAVAAVLVVSVDRHDVPTGTESLLRQEQLQLPRVNLHPVSLHHGRKIGGRLGMKAMFVAHVKAPLGGFLGDQPLRIPPPYLTIRILLF
jgi:hypothetical protein